MFHGSGALALGFALCAAFAAPPVARSEIDLNWRPATLTVRAGDTVSIGLYAVSDDPQASQSISAMDMILAWPAESLHLLGVVDNGPYDWFMSTFPDDAALDGLNDTFADGNALYSAYTSFGNPAWATPEGLLVTTFEFAALAETPEAVITILDRAGQYTHTAVFDGEIAGLDVHGILGSATVTILALPGDCDHDLDVDLDDYAVFQGCFGGPEEGPAPPECQDADLDEDGDVDLCDFAAIQRSFSGNQP